MRTTLALPVALTLLAIPALAAAQEGKEWPPPSSDPEPEPEPPPAEEPTDPVPPPPPATTTPAPVVQSQPAPAPEPAPTFQPQRTVDPRVDKRFLLDFFFHLGWAGTYDVTSSDFLLGERSNALSLGPGGGIRATWLIGHYFGLGPMLRVSGTTIEGASGSGTYFANDASYALTDLDLSLMGRIPLGFMDVMITVPFGLTVTVLDFSDSSNVGAGWNAGLSAGARFWLGTVFNLFVEAGFVYRGVVDTVNGVVDDDFVTDSVAANVIQGTFQVGASVGF